MKRRKKIIKIVVGFGSDFQERAGMDLIKVMLAAAKTHIEPRHKENSFDFSIDEEYRKGDFAKK